MERERVNAGITLRSLIAARWVMTALVAVAVAVASLAADRLPAGLIPRSDYPLGVALTLAGWTVLNLLSMVALARGQASERLAGVHLLVDALGLSVLLACSGGPANPFTILYFLPITLATQVSPRWTWALAGVCVACFAGLFLVTPAASGDARGHQASAASHHDPEVEHHGGHGGHGQTPAADPERAAPGHAEHFEGHQRGMWVAFGIVGVLITIFVHRTALALSRQRDELARLRQLALEDRHLTALGTLAAGAAHELGTPLATIKLLVDELPHVDDDERRRAWETMRAQVDRCKLILSRMASPDLRIQAFAAAQSWPVTALLDAIAGEEFGVDVELVGRDVVADLRTTPPRAILSQLVRELLHNAAEATRRGGADRPAVSVRLRERDGRLHLDIVDRGDGMDADTLEAAFSPFHSGRPEGEGMGLGLYLARAHLRQLGGAITLESEPGRGTTVHLEVPLAPGPDREPGRA